jgi:hypothetical protein
VCAALLGPPACGERGGDAQEGTGSPIGTVPTVVAVPGLIAGQQSTVGRLDDAVVVVDPEAGTTESVAVADIALASGVAAGPGRAFYGSGEDLVLVDAAAGTVTDLGLDVSSYSPAVAALTGGVGDRYAVLAGAEGTEPAVLVDLTSSAVTDLSGATGDTEVFAAELSADESRALLSSEEATFLVATDDPSSGERVGDGFGQFLGDGSSILVTGSDGTVVRTLATGDEVPLSDDPASGGLALDNRVVLARDDEVQLVDPTTGDVLASVPLEDAADAPVVAGDAVLVGGADQSWTLLDGATAEVTPLGDLTGFTPSRAPRTDRWVPFEATAADDLTVLGVDTGDGSVVTLDALPEGEQISTFAAFAPVGPWALVATDSPERGGAPVTHGRLVDLDTGAVVDLGPGFQGGAFSPDGEQVAWSSGPEAELRVAPVDDVSAAEVLATGIAVPIWLTT